MVWKHPQEVGETYWEHARAALKISYVLFRGSTNAFVHALLPDLPLPEKYTLPSIAEWSVRQAVKRTSSKR